MEHLDSVAIVFMNGPIVCMLVQLGETKVLDDGKGLSRFQQGFMCTASYQYYLGESFGG